ncbi:hypothetical protein ACIO87_37555 [Streptomyces sp. NPDC087218]|uniref:hypothetical protein n=1 Tax=Streptomyces sp. NPDC087218 TaxID=3365769 RepID=UPI0038092DF3
MSRRSRAFTLGAGAVLSSGLLTLLTSSPAWADATVSTVGARAEFRDYGEHLSVCDTATDGRRALARVQWPASPSSPSDIHIAYAEDADGNNGNCFEVPYDIDIPEGMRVAIDIWIQDGPDTDNYENWRTIYTTA